MPEPTLFQGRLVPKGAKLAGYARLVHDLALRVPVRAPRAIAEGHVRGSRRVEDDWTVLDRRYAPGDSATNHLAFALRHEAVDLLILKRAFEAIDANELVAFIKATPTGVASRRAWFLYERLTGRTLPLEDAKAVAAADALDPAAYFTGGPILSQRHRIRDNLLGTGSYCPIIRRTSALEAFVSRRLAEKAAEFVGRTGTHLIARAASFLLLADSRASFEIEGEHPPRSRLERWGRAVLQAGRNPLSMAELERLHGVLIEDRRFTRVGLRADGVFVGDRDHNLDPYPEFIGARPSDLPALVDGMITANDRMRGSAIDPVLQAAATAFGFVYIHPYEDGNGRLHRCLIHHVLAERRFAPIGMIFPVSSVMLDRLEAYRDTLRAHSGPLMDFIDWRPTPDHNVEVVNDTADLYRYFDCTSEAEFLYDCVAHTVERDLPREIEFLRCQDEAETRIMGVVDMPDRLMRNLLMFMRQNDGVLSKRRRDSEFAALTDAEVRAIEEIYRDVFGSE